jgi:predicted CopG family antitoxin
LGTKTIGLREDVYDRLKARKRQGESFTDLIDRLLAEADVDWRDGFGSLDVEDMEELERHAARSRSNASMGLERRQSEAITELAEATEDRNETS